MIIHAGTLQALTPTYSLFGMEIPLDYARNAEDLYHMQEWLGYEDCGITVRLATEFIVPAPGRLGVPA